MVQQSKNFLFGRKTTILCNFAVAITVQETGSEVWDKAGSNPAQPVCSHTLPILLIALPYVKIMSTVKSYVMSILR